ncbi:sulfotransferase family cytosolic 1B member 1, partial [Biomphalaria glabrata]
VYTSQFDYLRQMSQFQQEHPDHPITHLLRRNEQGKPTRSIHILPDVVSLLTSM